MMKNVHVGWAPVGMTKIMSGKNTTLKLSKKRITAELGSEFTLTINSEYEETPVWKSSNENVAVVDLEGNVTIVGYGVATIIVISGELKGTCSVSVPEPVIPDEPDEPVVPEEPTSKLDKTKIYYGTITPSLDDFSGYSYFTEQDFVDAIESGTLISTSLSKQENLTVALLEFQALVILIPSSSKLKAYKSELGNEKQFEETNTGANWHANGEIVTGDFKVFGEMITVPNFSGNFIINIHE